MIENAQPKLHVATPTRFHNFLIDLVIYVAVMFLVRELTIPNVGFIANGLFYSLSTLVVATWRMKVRGVTWKELGFCKPKSLLKTLLVSVAIFFGIISSIITFEITKDLVPFFAESEPSTEGTRFGDLKGNFSLFLSIIVFVWIESALEELLDRGFLMNWLERLFIRSFSRLKSKALLASLAAVVIQAAIFGFRHAPSHGISGAITVCLIGLVMGFAYLVSGRNLWPLIIAHAALNTMSMLERTL